MSCRKYQYLIGTEEAGRLAEDEALQTHLQGCAQCAQLAREMQQLSGVLRALEPLQAGESFGTTVSRRLVGGPRSEPWWGRVLGALQAPAPVLQPRQALAAAWLIALATVTLVVLLHPWA